MSKNFYNNPINGEEHVREQLSDYMDGLLSGDARRAVRQHLEECADCRADYIELRATQRAMQSLPTVAAPRAFTLTPEMAHRARRPSFWETFFARRNAPRLATGSLVAFLLLALFIGNDFFGNTGSPASFELRTGQHAPSFSSGGAQSQAAPAPTTTTAAAAPQVDQATISSAAAAPTDTTQPSAAGPASGSAPASVAPDASTSSTGVSNPEASAIAKQASGVTASGNSSPTTTTLLAPPVQGTAPNTPEVAPQPAATPAPANTTGAGLIVLQAGLLVVALGLAIAAVIAWRHT